MSMRHLNFETCAGKPPIMQVGAAARHRQWFDKVSTFMRHWLRKGVQCTALKAGFPATMELAARLFVEIRWITLQNICGNFNCSHHGAQLSSPFKAIICKRNVSNISLVFLFNACGVFMCALNTALFVASAFQHWCVAIREHLEE